MNSRRQSCEILRSAALALAVGSAFIAGCAHSEMARQRAHMREDGMANSARVFVRHEAEAPERMNRTLAAVDEKHRADVLATDENGRKIDGWLEFDRRRWDERQPEYRRHIENQLNGKPESIEPNAILLFW